MADRRPKTLRDMALSVGLLAIVVLALVGMYGGVSLSPGGPSQGQTPTADVTGGLHQAEPVVGFPVSVPVVPAGWHPSSLSVTEKSSDAAGSAPAVRAGWVTDSGRFITLIQSRGPVADVLTTELGGAAPASGIEQTGGTPWTVTSGRRNEQAWYRIAGDVVQLITGPASPDDFRVLATAAMTAN